MNVLLFAACIAGNIDFPLNGHTFTAVDAEIKIPFVYTLRGWPDLTWDSAALGYRLGQVRHRQGLLVGRLSALGVGLQSEAELDALTEEIVKSSAIEGQSLPPEAVRSSVARRLGIETAGVVNASREVEGVVDLMLDATQRFDEPLTDDRLFAWHAALFPTGRSGVHRVSVGQWRDDRDGPMQVVSGPMGKERVHYEAPPAHDVPREMARFLEWMRSADDTDPVLRAGLAHFWFVTIHPFEDGNGRIARAITELQLARSDHRRTRFYSMSGQIEAERGEYYQQLERAQRGGLDITPWMRWFLECLDRALLRAEETLERVLHKAWIWDRAHAHGVNDRQRAVLGRMLGYWQGNLTSSKYAKIAGCSPDTALRDILGLIDAGVLRRNEAGGRSASYRLEERAAGG